MSGIDPAIYNELETLRNIKLNLEAECNGLGNQLNSQNDEMNSLKMTLNQRNHEIEEMKSSLKGALDKSKKLSDNLASMEKKNSSSSGQFEVKNKNKIEIINLHARELKNLQNEKRKPKDSSNLLSKRINTSRCIIVNVC